MSPKCVLTLLFTIIPVIAGMCSDSDIVIFVTENDAASEACEIKGLSEEGASKSTHCNITCTCKDKVTNCSDGTKSIVVDNMCDVVYKGETQQLLCVDDIEGVVANPSEDNTSAQDVLRIMKLLSAARSKHVDDDVEEATTTEELAYDVGLVGERTTPDDLPTRPPTTPPGE